MNMINDPYYKIATDMYKEYCTSKLKYEDHWKRKLVYCPVCDCNIVYPRSYEHRLTKKHEKNLKKLRQNSMDVFD